MSVIPSFILHPFKILFLFKPSGEGSEFTGLDSSLNSVASFIVLPSQHENLKFDFEGSSSFSVPWDGENQRRSSSLLKFPSPNVESQFLYHHSGIKAFSLHIIKYKQMEKQVKRKAEDYLNILSTSSKLPISCHP